MELERNVSIDGMGGNGGYGMGGGFGAGLVGGIFGSALFGRGRGFDSGYSHGGYAGGVDNTLAYLVGQGQGLEAKTSDVVAATANINDVTRNTGATVLNNLNALDSKVNAGQVAMLQGFSNVDRGLCDNRHASDMQFAMMQKDMALQHCAIEKMISCDGEKTRAMLAAQNDSRWEDKLEATRFQLNEVQRQRDLLATGNFPVSTPAHVERHCGHSHEDGVDIRINAIGNEVNSLKFQNQQILQALNGIAAAGQSGLQK